MNKLIAIIILTLEAYAVYRIYKRMHRKRLPYADTAPLAGPVQELARLMQHLADLDTMLLDVQSCKAGELHRNFAFRWMSGGNVNKELSLLIDGENGSTEAMLIAAEDERERTNKAIITKIYEIAEQLNDLQKETAPQEGAKVLTPDTKNDTEPTSTEIQESFAKLQQRYSYVLQSPAKRRNVWHMLRH